MEESLFLYSESKAPFDALVQAGEISKSRIGIIGETGEIWVKGQYLSIAKDFVKIGKSTDTSHDNTLLGWANGLKSSLDITVKTHQTDDGHTVYRLYKGLRRIASISVPELSNNDDSNNWITFIPEVAIDKDEDDNTDGGENIVTKIKLQPHIVPISQASASNNGLATANDVRETVSKKQDNISDLTTIRNGSRKGASSVQQVKVNDTTITPDSNGVVDLGSIEGGGGGVVDFANDLTGVVEATPEQFTFRPSAGDKSVRDESAVIRRIKGSSVIFSQSAGYVKNSAYKGVSITHNNNGVVELSGELSDGTTVQSGYLSNVYGHIYLIVMEVLSMGDATSFIGGNLNVANVTFKEAGKKWKIATSSRTSNLAYIGIYNLIGSYNGVKFRFQQFDLTEMFGAGNEPTTYEEFRQYYPDAYYPYRAPEIRSMRATSIETIGFNAFNGEYAEVIGGQAYYLGGAIDNAHFATEVGGELKEITITGNRLYTPSENGYIYATGSGICINLSHSGVRNGEYESYEKNTLLLPEIAKYFPNGMHGIGDVCDEINEEMAIQRCSVRAYEEGDENNAEVKTDKTTTVYKLSEPIYTPIDEPLQLDYKVDDFGTERMLNNEPSSPFKADIVYQFNAEGRIRDNSRNIERLENKIRDIANVTTGIALQRMVLDSTVTSLLPNVVYEGISSYPNIEIPPLQVGKVDMRNVWKVFVRVQDGNINFPFDVKWKDGVAPTYSGFEYVELTFFDNVLNDIYGEWKVYK